MNLALASDALRDMATVLQISDKSVTSIARKFHADLRRLVTLGFVSDSSILGDLRRLVKNAIADAYVEGLAEGDVSADEMSDDDALMIIELGDRQLEHVTNFVRDIRDAKNDKAAQRDILDRRLDLWTASVESAGAQGIASAKSNTMGTWQYGDSEHCATCAKLNGQRHRLKWFLSNGYIPREPGSQTLDCGGWACQCKIVDERGRQLLPA